MYKDPSRRPRSSRSARPASPNAQSHGITQSPTPGARIAADLLPDVLDVDQGRDGADLGVLRAL
jgi:hypothetical protein